MPPVTPPPDAVPELIISTTTSDAELLAAHKLITDSIAQQRATLVRSLLFSHPHLTLPPYILLISLLYAQNSNLATALLLGAGCTIAILSACGRFTEDYIELAEKVGSSDGYEGMMDGKVVVVARWGDAKEVIGTAVVDVLEGEKRGVVNAFTVRLKYRKHGVGRGVLEEVVRVVRARLGEEAEVVFADKHANSFRIPSVPRIFNKVFDKEERKAKAMLQNVVKTQTL